MSDSPSTPRSAEVDDAQDNEEYAQDNEELGFRQRAAADRPPTAEEERAAERAASDVDLERVAEHYEDMTNIGAHVRGEGEVEPD